ncbi:thioesterase family protein [Mycobacterium sp. NPDC003323]
MTDAYYQLLDVDDPIGERFAASDHVISTWAPDMQGAAPVSALLVRSLLRCDPREDARLSRVVVDLLGPVPVAGTLWMRADRRRAGTKIELLDAEMLATGPDGAPRTVAEARAWRFQVHDTAELARSTQAPLRPRTEATPRSMNRGPDATFVDTLDWWWLNDVLHSEPAECWVRSTVDLVSGEVPTTMERLFCVADVANGMGSKLDVRRWTFLNTDLTVHLHRQPVGDWFGIRAVSNYGADGVGTSVATLFDADGPVAAMQQAQLVRRRP